MLTNSSKIQAFLKSLNIESKVQPIHLKGVDLTLPDTQGEKFICALVIDEFKSLPNPLPKNTMLVLVLGPAMPLLKNEIKILKASSYERGAKAVTYTTHYLNTGESKEIIPDILKFVNQP